MFQLDQQQAHQTFLNNQKIDRANEARFRRKTGFQFGVPSGIFQEKCDLAIPEYSDVRDHVVQSMLKDITKESRKAGKEFAKRMGLEKLSKKAEAEEAKWELINSWKSNDPKTSSGTVEVLVWKNIHTGQKMHRINRVAPRHIESSEMLLDSLDRSSRYHDHPAELKALKLLKGYLTPVQERQLDLTGAFVENKTKSGLMYLLRRSRPTLAYRYTKTHGLRMIAALCLHPLGYYSNTFTGTMVPSDELLAHLMYVRTDEYGFWKRANHHSIKDPRSGIG